MKAAVNQMMLCIFAIVSLLHAVDCPAQDASARAIVLVPRDLNWSESARAPGVHTATVTGDPSKPGPYVIRAKYPPNTVNGPHYHPADEEITVLSGTLYFGEGLAMTLEETMTVPAGSFIAQPAKRWHFLFTKAESVELEIRGIGPRTNVFAK